MLRESVGGKVHGVQALTGKRRRQTSPDCWDSVRFDAKVWRIFKIRRESLILSLTKVRHGCTKISYNGAQRDSL